ncbi:alpha/beta hydrolase family protein [Spongiimicrobium sp. 2-473A-2-J]|uniref:alpha/beta hydrolase family protein n=1 Tax=Eudoraea algarum TaxID=3417568 RepID=UPI003D36E8D7
MCLRSIILFAQTCTLLFSQFLFPQLPEPSGPHCVGKMKFQINIGDRPEQYTESPSDFRKLAVDVWYPSTCNGDLARYMHPKVFQAYKASKKLGDSVDISFMQQLKTHAHLNAKVVPGLPAAPVLVFSHGSSTPVELYTSFMLQLASHGYFVFAVSHTYNSIAVEFPDGSVVTANRTYFDKRWTDAINTGWEDMMTFVKSGADLEAKRAKVQTLYGSDFPASGDMKIWPADIASAIDLAITLNKDRAGPFHKRLNTRKIGGFGHSYGGSAMANALISDSRIKVAVNLDGWQFGPVVIGHRFKKPFLYVRGGYPQPDALNTAVYSLAGPKFKQLKIIGTGHSDFTDLPLFSGKDNIFNTGELHPTRNTYVISDILLTFFDAHLKRKKATWSSLLRNYPEAQFE